MKLFTTGLTPAQMVELVDTQDLKSCDLKSRAGSIPALSTKPLYESREAFFLQNVKHFKKDCVL